MVAAIVMTEFTLISRLALASVAMVEITASAAACATDQTCGWVVARGRRTREGSIRWRRSLQTTHCCHPIAVAYRCHPQRGGIGDGVFCSHLAVENAYGLCTSFPKLATVVMGGNLQRAAEGSCLTMLARLYCGESGRRSLRGLQIGQGELADSSQEALRQNVRRAVRRVGEVIALAPDARGSCWYVVCFGFQDGGACRMTAPMR